MNDITLINEKSLVFKCLKSLITTEPVLKLFSPILELHTIKRKYVVFHTKIHAKRE